jgi:hypothetical protein
MASSSQKSWEKPGYAVGIFRCLAAAVQSSRKSHSTPDISNRPRRDGLHFSGGLYRKWKSGAMPVDDDPRPKAGP